MQTTLDWKEHAGGALLVSGTMQVPKTLFGFNTANYQCFHIFESQETKTGECPIFYLINYPESPARQVITSATTVQELLDGNPEARIMIAYLEYGD